MSGNELLFTVFGIGIAAVVVWFVYIIFIKEKLLKAKGIAGKLEHVLKKDTSSKCARCTFYAFNDYENGYSQREWVEFCKQRMGNGELDEKSEEYAEAVAPIINAIVVDEGGWYIRRGLQNMEHSGEDFAPGVNDAISLNYFVEPYKYVKNARGAKAFKNARPAVQDSAEEKARHDAFVRCRNCVHERDCDIRMKRQTGPCGGYTPKEKKKLF